MSGFITNWIISIVGVVVLGVLIDLILPDGQMRKYIKSVFSVIIVVTMVSPVLNINFDDINFDQFLYNKTSVELNQNYLSNSNEEYQKALEELIENSLKEAGFDGVDAEIYFKLSNSKFEVEKVELNLKKIVINTNQVHIDKYKEMREVVENLLNIKEDKIVFYG